MPDPPGERFAMLFDPDELEGLPACVKQSLAEDQCPAVRLSWPLLRGEISEAVAKELDWDVYDMIGRGWAAAAELREYRDDRLHPPNQKAAIRFGQHKVSATLHPVLAIDIAGYQCPDIKFDAVLAATFSAVTLTIENKHITGFTAGECDLTVELRHRETTLCKPKSVKRVTLPSSVRFDPPGIPIR